MTLDNKTWGVPVADTFLLLHGRAPRRSEKDRNALVWCECILCGEFFEVRRANVGPHHTVSCGCHGLKVFKNYMEEQARKLDPRVRARIFKLRYQHRGWSRQRRARKINFFRWTEEVAKHLGIDKAVVDFSYRLHCDIIKGLAAMGRKARRVLTRLERIWLGRHRKAELRPEDPNDREERFKDEEARRSHEAAPCWQRLLRAGEYFRREQANRQANDEREERMRRLLKSKLASPEARILYRREKAEITEEMRSARQAGVTAAEVFGIDVTYPEIGSQDFLEAGRCAWRHVKKQLQDDVHEEVYGFRSLQDEGLVIEFPVPTLYERVLEIAFRDVCAWTPKWRPAEA